MTKTSSQVLSMEEILLGGDSPFHPFEVPELSKGGKPGVVYLRDVTTEEVMKLGELKKAPAVKRNAQQYRLVARALVTKDGQPLFPNEEDAKKVSSMPAGAFMRILTELTASASGKDGEPEGNVSAGADSGDSPTN